MITCLAKFWIRESDSEEKKRRVYGTLGAVVGIFLNICLFAGKYLAGFLSGSIAIMADAFNNLSDAGSSFISLIGFVFSGKKPDLDHPFGHGRIEYLAGLLSDPFNGRGTGKKFGAEDIASGQCTDQYAVYRCVISIHSG